MPEEIQGFQEKLKKLAAVLEKTVDLDGLLSLGEAAPSLAISKETKQHLENPQKTGQQLRIGVACDQAFCFFYEDNFQFLRDRGANLVFFSPIEQEHLPENLDGQFLRDRGANLVFFSPIEQEHLPENLDGLLLYGGYPELFGKQLEENKTMREDIRKMLEKKLPVMAECGGFMYLHEYFERIF